VLIRTATIEKPNKTENFFIVLLHFLAASAFFMG